MSKRIAIWSFFTTLLLVIHLLKLKSFDLSADDGFIPGQATANGVSIGKRIQQSYLLIGIGLAFCTLLYQVLKRFEERIDRNKLVGFADRLLPLGIVLAVISLFNSMLIESAQLIGFFTLLLLLFGSLKNLNPSLLQSSTWLVSGLGFVTNFTLFHSAVIGGAAALLILLLVQHYSFNKLWVLWISGIVIAVPVIVFTGIESTLILNQREVFLSNYWIMLFVWLIVFGSFFFFYIRRNLSSTEKLVYRLFVPLAIIGIGIVQTYAPLIVQPDETFETANILNPVMQFELFGEIPMLDNLSSHLVSDFFWTFIYSGLNGYHGDASLLIYNGFTYIFVLLIVYFFLRTIIGNKPVVVLILFLIPALFYFIPFYYSFALLPVTFFYRYVQNKERREIIWFLTAICTVVLWRLDLGVSLIFTLLAFFPFWFYYNWEGSKSLFKWMAIFGGIGGILGALFVFNYPSEFHQMKAYFGANQAHGLPTVAYQEINAFYLHYLVLPVLIGGITLHSIALFRKAESKAELSLLIILCLFYFFNLQRGLVRHSFMENNDTQISSFAWLIIAYKFWLWTKENAATKVNPLMALSAASIVPLFMSVNFLNGSQNVVQRTPQFSVKDFPKLEGKRIDRVVASPVFEQNNRELIEFLSKELKGKQTFLDFSNTPLLYFYSGKNVPSYFNQYLQNTVTTDLQLENLKHLKNYDIPFVVFSHTPETVYDNTDYVPNKIRYYKITGLIYNKYEPFAKIGSYRVWKRKDVKKIVPAQQSYNLHEESWNLGLIPYYWKPAKEEKFILNKSSRAFILNNNKLYWHHSIRPDEFLQVSITSVNDQQLYLASYGLKIQMTLKKGTHTYYIPVGCSEQMKANYSQYLDLWSESKITLNDYHFVSLANR
jgi:hypothetical protein